ncbi:MAG: hypothetical protein HQ481_15130 [Alphaproteobacteria bacterium]|nr:hypothetical protein [Alphaproteobacteria bacterium]
MRGLSDSPDTRSWLSALEAAAELNVSRATLYAYVSRGLLESQGQPGSRKRLYAATDVRRLRAARDADTDAPERALSFGAPLLDSAITLIRDGRFYYRGRDALALARSADLETVAGLLWQTDDLDPFAAPPPDITPDTPAGIPAAIATLARAGAHDVTAHARTSAARAKTAARILRLMIVVWTGEAASLRPAHVTLAEAWKVPEAAPAIRTALILCADHELNASAFAVRVAASTGAGPYASVIAGLATLEGPRHGGQTPQTLALIDEAVRLGDGRAAVLERLQRGDSLPGFGHRLYDGADPRAEAIRASLRASVGDHPVLSLTDAVADTGREATGLFPNLDFGLATLAATWALGPAQALGLFAIGRTVGWLAHAAEQTASGALIRPRARYTGPDPRTDHGNRQP